MVFSSSDFLAFKGFVFLFVLVHGVLQKRLTQALGEPVESLFEAGGKETWPSIRTLLKRETETAVRDFLDVVTGFELDHATIDAMVQNLKNYSQSVVEKKAREEAAKILIRMKDRQEKRTEYTPINSLCSVYSA